jgi:hypothetical protein
MLSGVLSIDREESNGFMAKAHSNAVERDAQGAKVVADGTSADT